MQATGQTPGAFPCGDARTDKQAVAVLARSIAPLYDSKHSKHMLDAVYKSAATLKRGLCAAARLKVQKRMLWWMKERLTRCSSAKLAPRLQRAAPVKKPWCACSFFGRNLRGVLCFIPVRLLCQLPARCQ